MTYTLSWGQQYITLEIVVMGYHTMYYNNPEDHNVSHILV